MLMRIVREEGPRALYKGALFFRPAPHTHHEYKYTHSDMVGVTPNLVGNAMAWGGYFLW